MMKFKFDTLTDKINFSIQAHRLIFECEQIGMGWFVKLTPFKKYLKQLDDEIAKARKEK